MMKNEDIERICFNCNYFFPASMEELTEFGICLNDKDFDPFVDQLLGDSNYSCCQDLIDTKKFTGNREACPDFSEAEIGETIEIDENSEFGRDLISSIKSGNFNTKKLEELLVEEQIRNIDFKTLPIDTYSKQLRSPRSEERDAAISSLGALIARENRAAFQELFTFLKQLPPLETIEDVHLKKDILRCLEYSVSSTALTELLLDELNNTPSSNTTRQWISAILRFLERRPVGEIREPLERMLRKNRFSYRLKQKIKTLLHRKEEERA